MKTFLSAAAVLFAAASIAGTAQAAKYPSYQGEWTLNEAQSHYPAGVPEMKDHVITVSKDDGTNLAYSDSLTVGGKPISASFDGAYGGKPVTMSSGQVTRVYHDKDGFHDKWTGPDGSSGRWAILSNHSHLSPDEWHSVSHPIIDMLVAGRAKRR